MDDEHPPGTDASAEEVPLSPGASDVTLPEPGPSIDEFEPRFVVYDSRTDGEELSYYGTPLADPEAVMREVWPAFHALGYEAHMTHRNGEHVIVAEPAEVGVTAVPWTNLALFFATVLSTLFAGAWWYQLDPIADPLSMWRAWPFATAILFVLGVHEMGHYVASRYHRVKASLPYFLPVPTLIGTMGAVITMKGRIPNRRALFDIGVSGPLAGLVATVLVTVIGLHLPPVTAPESVANDPDAMLLYLGYPPLLEGLAAMVDQPLYRDDPTTSVNPVVIAGWVGMFITFLNLIPVGQLDGGHVLRAMVGEYQRTLSALVPGLLFALAGYIYYATAHGFTGITVWVFWGLFATLLAAAGPADPVTDEPIGRGRLAIGFVTFVLGALCFMAVPVAIVEP